MWDYAFNKYRTAFPSTSGVTISGPAYTAPPNEGNSWWTKWADHMKNNPAVYPDVITYHQLLGRQNSFNDPVESRRVFDIIQSKNNLPRKLTQINGRFLFDWRRKSRDLLIDHRLAQSSRDRTNKAPLTPPGSSVVSSDRANKDFEPTGATVETCTTTSLVSSVG